MSRRPFLAGNWKMNKLVNESVDLVKGILDGVKDITDRDILVCPPFTSLSEVSKLVKGTNIKLGAQNCSYKDSGAYTGEISPSMLVDLGCSYVILGHSERRIYFGETNEIINEKAKLAISKGLKVIYCVGEVLEERQNNKTFDVIKEQLEKVLYDLDLNNVIVAYEPVWAIGTGLSASPEQAEEVHAFIRKTVSNIIKTSGKSYDVENLVILYGGSVKSSSIKGLMECEDVDGGLIGGASLKINEFLDIIRMSK